MSIIEPKTLSFLKQLQKNNNRDWFNDHKDEFVAINSKVKTNFEFVFQNLMVHDEVDQFKMYRIYRDIRFSKNKIPYKTYFSGAFHRKKPTLRGGYYIQLEPGNKSFIAGGFWDPSKDDLLRIRKEFEMDDFEIRAILTASDFKNTWGDFVGDTLKTAPRGFDKTHSAIDLIKRKQFIFTKTFTDEQVLNSDFLMKVSEDFKTIRPFFDYMSALLTTNLNGESII